MSSDQSMMLLVLAVRDLTRAVRALKPAQATTPLPGAQKPATPPLDGFVGPASVLRTVTKVHPYAGDME